MICSTTGRECKLGCDVTALGRRCRSTICPNDNQPCDCTSGALCLEGDGPRPRVFVREIYINGSKDKSMRCTINSKPCGCSGQCRIAEIVDPPDPLNESERFVPPVASCAVDAKPCTCNGAICTHAKVSIDLSPFTDDRNLAPPPKMSGFKPYEYRDVTATFHNMQADGWSWAFEFGDVKFGGVGIDMVAALQSFRGCVDTKLEILRRVQKV